MSQDLDVYRDWLSIKDAQRPLNHYQLLRLKQFEDDVARVRTHYRKLNAHVRKYAAGEFAKESQDLLNELARAMLCLTDARRKAEYDASLGREDAGGKRRRTFDELLLLRKVLTQEQLADSRSYADAVGLEVRDAVVQKKLARPEIVMQIYAEAEGVPYVDLADVGVDVQLVPQVPALLARQNSCVPVMVDDGQLLMASPNPLAPDVEDELRLRTGMQVRSVLCTPLSINAVLGKHFTKEAAEAEKAAGGIASGGAPPSASPTAAAEQPAKQAKQAKPAQTFSEDEKKEHRKIALLVGSMTVTGSMVVQQLLFTPPITFWLSAPISLALGGVIFWITLKIVQR